MVMARAERADRQIGSTDSWRVELMQDGAAGR